MELYLKRYFWVVILVCIASSTWLVARTGNTFVGAALEPGPLLGYESPASSRPQTQAVATADVTRVGHLFGIDPPPPPTTEELEKAAGASKPVDTKICYTCAPVKTGLRLQLLAAMVANEKHWSTALISDLDKQESVLYQVGDHIRNLDVYDVTRDPNRCIVVNNDTHRLEYIDDVAGTGATVTTGLGNLGTSEVPAPGGEGGGGDQSAGITKIDATHTKITREKLDSTLANMNDLATQARIVPSFKNGQADGFKLFSIQPGSVYSALGIQNGDVIQSINGLEINSPEKALEAYTRLKDAGNFDITLDRRGAPVKMNYQIQ
jgi:general secretion pathway protein C